MFKIDVPAVQNLTIINPEFDLHGNLTFLPLKEEVDVDARIVDGTFAAKSEFPWQTLLYLCECYISVLKFW
jgi:hypothetical protein